MELMIIFLLMLIIPIYASIKVNLSYKKYVKIDNEKKLTGFDVARRILDENNLGEIYVVETKGTMSDHYDPGRKTVRLSTDVYHGTSISSLAIAAHECGHAIQDKEGYSFMRFRSMMFPLVRFSSYGGYIAILVGALFGLMDLIWFGIGLEIVILLFQIVTLPVEFNASSRAKDELAKYNLLNNNEINSSDKMLRAAAYTYVASVLTTILQILRLIVMFSDRDN
mgnify:CR=1 FL=1